MFYTKVFFSFRYVYYIFQEKSIYFIECQRYVILAKYCSSKILFSYLGHRTEKILYSVHVIKVKAYFLILKDRL